MIKRPVAGTESSDPTQATFTNANSDKWTISYSGISSSRSSPTAVSSDLAVTASGTIRKYTVAATAGTGVSDIYVCKNSSGSDLGIPGVTEFSYDSTVYCIVVLKANYGPQAGWTSVTLPGDIQGYRTGSLTVGTSSSFGTVSAVQLTYNVYWGTNTGITGLFLTTNYGATSGSSSGASFNAGSTVYLFFSLQSGYQAPSGASYNGANGHYYYSVSNLSSNYTFPNIDAPQSPKIYFKNSTGTNITVNGTSISSGSTYTYTYSSDTSVSVTCSTAGSTSIYVTSSSVGKTYTITKGPARKIMGTLTKSKKKTSVSASYTCPSYATTGAPTSSNWGYYCSDSTATVTITGNGGAGGYYYVTATLEGIPSVVSTATIYFYDTYQLSYSSN